MLNSSSMAITNCRCATESHCCILLLSTDETSNVAGRANPCRNENWSLSLASKVMKSLTRELPNGCAGI
jgi:hypothetical protein